MNSLYRVLKKVGYLGLRLAFSLSNLAVALAMSTSDSTATVDLGNLALSRAPKKHISKN